MQGDPELIPGLGESGGKGYPSQYSGLENSELDSPGVRGQTGLRNDFHFHF